MATDDTSPAGSTAAASTTPERFSALLTEHRVIPVVRELFADGETPVGIYRKLAAGRPGSFLLESAEQGGIWSRFSFVGVSSFGVLTQQGDEARWLDYGMSAARALGDVVDLGPLAALAALHARWETPKMPGHPPLTGGLVGFIGWEAIRQIEHLPNRPPADYEVPGQAFSFVADLVVIDHKYGTVQLIANVLNDGFDTPDVLWASAQHRLDALQTRLAEPSEAWLAEVDLSTPASPANRTKREDFLASVDVAKDHIVAGDVFQVVISQRFDQECTADPIDVYRVLRSLNPSPYMYLLSLESPAGDGYWIVGSSPEALVKVQNDRVFTHPIAGSKPRGATPEADAAFETELAGDPKERAEHLMLVDLARNDLLKVCAAGSVEVTEFMRIERFSHIMHLVSSVEGNLLPNRSAIDVFRATFPAGTLSGAPKPRALEIIDDLEPAQRGVYGGVVGYFGFAGDADLAIAIRTATIMNGVARVQAGGGLVADSDPASEYQESQNKAAAPLRAVAVANAMKRVR
ncbi:anthranilate synthase component I [Cryobacterium sp. TMT1-21]|uniref:Anthranilate synthase component 1 n=2 Tax=Microbacteriaceae TaxID=85023 RepID=A0AAQ2C7T5_9MICO|nr:MULTISPECIES: anthranilate synthase component I [Cryobacterium]TFC51629.1 anthranilate synthase component I [Cryobacterium shii]TFC83624.1 anthranilate synthase component I [Cryobacterium sp. TmT2-59]TFD13597.1 anthranilate synthase component I [Cryobacterium sp. TMT4-10]TFD16041.1 anthranilate synthase component I [Cryobacterium sp. TMT1-21]TFD27131.1 anthranilate synthase component I [Cryobacterium sp. TMT2-23]